MTNSINYLFFNPFKKLDTYPETTSMSSTEKESLVAFCKRKEMTVVWTWLLAIAAIFMFSLYAFTNSIIDDFGMSGIWNVALSLLVFMICFFAGGYLLGLARHIAFSKNLHKFLQQK